MVVTTHYSGTGAAEVALRAIERDVATPLGLGLLEAASAILRLATENMVSAIEEITINQGIDPRGAVLIGGGRRHVVAVRDDSFSI